MVTSKVPGRVPGVLRRSLACFQTAAPYFGLETDMVADRIPQSLFAAQIRKILYTAIIEFALISAKDVIASPYAPCPLCLSNTGSCP
jgi:hypothetical protein